MTKYAQGTDVGVERSRNELERMLRAHGATGYVSGWDDRDGRHAVMFRITDRMVRLTVARPSPDDRDVRLTPTGRRRTDAAASEAAQAEERRRWRSLVLVTKAKLVSVADGVQTIEQAFMADIVLPDGRTVSDWLTPQLETAYATAEMPSLMPGSSSTPALDSPAITS